MPISSVWVVKDTDQVIDNSTPLSPLKPVHGNVRVAIYLDGHAATRKTTLNGKADVE